MIQNKSPILWTVLLILTLGFSNMATYAQGKSGMQNKPAVKANKLRPAFPAMNARRGRKLFATKGCAVCHSINGVGGHIGPPLDWSNMPRPLDAFGFLARMWRGAASMSVMQEEVFGDVIKLTGQDLVDLVAFAHDAEEQKKLTEDQIPQKLRNILPK